RTRARDLLPEGVARLLPHARVRPRRDGLHERARSDPGDGHFDDPGEADRGSARAGRGHVAPLPAVQGGRTRPDGALYPDRGMRRGLAWTFAGAIVVLSARSVAYAL